MLPKHNLAVQMLSEEPTMNACFSQFWAKIQGSISPQPPASYQCQPNVNKARQQKRVKGKEKHLSSSQLPSVPGSGQATFVMNYGPLVVMFINACTIFSVLLSVIQNTDCSPNFITALWPNFQSLK